MNAFSLLDLIVLGLLGAAVVIMVRDRARRSGSTRENEAGWTDGDRLRHPHIVVTTHSDRGVSVMRPSMAALLSLRQAGCVAFLLLSVLLVIVGEVVVGIVSPLQPIDHTEQN